MGLTRYRQKRDFKKTAEPRGAESPTSTGFSYLIQKHDASRLHYDFRLQVGDVLASWAVPKGPSLDPAHKRLAVHVEDHPLEYGKFEGTIPKGEYGGGTVMLWDRGTWEPKPGQDPAAAIRRGKLEFTLHGERLGGAWALVRLAGTRGSDEHKDNWLLMKVADDHVRTPGESAINEWTTSVATGRTMEEIAAGAPVKAARRGRGKKNVEEVPAKAVWRSNKSQNDEARATDLDPSRLTNARPGPVPDSIAPQLCTLTDQAPSGDQWLHEIKYDGYRIVAIKSGKSVILQTRSGADWTAKFPALEAAIVKLPAKAVLDGELTVLDDQGHTSFQRLQNAIKARQSERMVYYVFDLLHLDGYDLSDAPLIERKELLRRLVPGTDQGPVRYSEHVRGSGTQVRQNACELALEGIICKRADAPYSQTRSKTWLKVKCSRRQEFAIIGWSPPSGARSHFGSLLLGTFDPEGRLHYAGRVGTGFDEDTLGDIKRRLDRITVDAIPVDDKLPGGETRGVTWVEPKLVAEVEFTEWTDDGRLRHPSFQGLREDKDAKLVRPEKPVPLKAIQPEHKATPMKSRAKAAADSAAPTVAGVRFTHPDRVLDPASGLTKLDLARYYEQVADRMLPYLVGRPLSTVRCPEGVTGQCFFQKHVRETFDGPVKAIRVREQDGDADYIAVDSVAGLVSLVQFGVIEIHPWSSTQDHIEQPDFLTFDLDPAPDVPFEEVKKATLDVRERLESLGINCFLKTTGGKGLHVVAPIKPELEWDAVKEFCSAFAKSLAAGDPARYIAVATKARRSRKVFIDYLRNARGATSIAPYGTRSRPGTPVALPLEWSELPGLTAANQFKTNDVLERLKRSRRDPWRDFDRKRISLAAVIAKVTGSSNPSSASKTLTSASSGLHRAAPRPNRISQGVISMPKAWSSKDERQYEHVKSSEKSAGRSTKRAKEIAARTVNKQRSKQGRTKTPGRKAGR